jgi:hypothetical protein
MNQPEDNPLEAARREKMAQLVKLGIEDPGSALVTTRGFMHDQSQIVERFIRAFVEAIALGKTDSKVTKKAFAKNLRERNDIYLDLLPPTSALGSISTTPMFPSEAIRNLISDLAEETPRIKTIPLPEVLDNSFIRRLEDEAPGEHREPPEKLLLGPLEQAVTPVQRRPHRALPRGEVPRRLGGERAVEA